MFSKCEKSNDGSNGVYEDGGKECPQEDIVPHFYKRRAINILGARERRRLKQLTRERG